MASYLDAGVRSAYYGIKKWLGVCESPDGDVNLRDGEAAEMRNFRITDSGAMQIRPGSKNVAGLMPASGYDISLGEETALFTELNSTTLSLTVFDECTLSSVGMPSLSGTESTLSFSASQDMQGSFFESGGKIYKFVRCTKGANGETEGTQDVPGGYVRLGDEIRYSPGSFSGPLIQDVMGYSSIGVENGAIVTLGEVTDSFATGTYHAMWKATAGEHGTISGWTMYVVKHSRKGTYTDSSGDEHTGYFGRIVSYAADVTYEWIAREASSSENTTPQPCRALWSGFVGGAERICAAACGRLWSLTMENGIWSKAEIGQINTDGRVGLFGFGDRLYILDGSEYYCWDGTESGFRMVEGYVPCLEIASPPEGGGTVYEKKNLLTQRRCQRFSGDGEATEYHLAEQSIQSVYKITVDDETLGTSEYSVNAYTGTVTFSEPPAQGTDNVRIWWVGSDIRRATAIHMRHAELFNGSNDSRVFLYGDGSSRAVYSGLDEDGKPTAEYFPEENEIEVGEANTPITSLVRHYDRLLAFKPGSAYSIYYGGLSLADGSYAAGFYIKPVNRSFGNEAAGQVCLVENRPRTLEAGGIYEWRGASSGNITGDQRNAQRISQKVWRTLLGFDPKNTVCFYDRVRGEYYCVCDGTAAVQNVNADAWYIYTDIPATAMIVYKDELYYATDDGWLRHISRDYRSDNDKAIDAYWESGSLSFDKSFMRKYSPELWVGLKPEQSSALTAGIETERSQRTEKTISERGEGGDVKPRMHRLKLKASKFTYYKLTLASCSAETTATVTDVDIRVKYSETVR